jgi:1-acyl-sn-glycerol-3-phosphate acyltransferase
MDELPRFSPTIVRWFALYLDRYFARNFTAVRLSRTSIEPDRVSGKLIVYSNHPSWWDPILFFLMGSSLLPGREGYGPMDAEMLEKYGIFRRMGVFGIERGTRAGAARFLRISEAVLERPGATLWVTAQGEFADPRDRPVRLAPGIAHLIPRVADLALVPLAVEYPFWNERRPEALARFGEPLRPTDDRRRRSTRDWRRELEQRLERTMDGLAEESASRDPARFRTLVRGRKGVGGVYDLWRRLVATARGRRFDPAHGRDGTPR